MFDRLIDFLLEFIERFYFFAIVHQYQEGCHLRCGKLLRNVEGGFWFICPIVDEVIRDNVVPRTVNLQAQSLTTRDGVSVVVGGVVTAYIYSIKKALLEVEGVDDALRDSCLGVISTMVGKATWDELHADDFTEGLTKGCHEQATQYGIRVKRVQLSDIARVRAFRLHIDQPMQKGVN